MASREITIVDSGVGNVGSIANMLRRCHGEAKVTADAAAVASAAKLILPGVGAFDAGMEALCRGSLDAALHDAVIGRGVPILGICLGLQLMARRSEEGQQAGLGWLRGDVVRFRTEGVGTTSLPLPNMGWRTVTFTAGARLGTGDANTRFYFAHSFHLRMDDGADVTGTSTYGYEFPAVVEVENMMGVQFHPEKSHRFGAELLRRFADR
jgi:glutamine amidotransferase